MGLPSTFPNPNPKQQKNYVLKNYARKNFLHRKIDRDLAYCASLLKKSFILSQKNLYTFLKEISQAEA